MNRKSFIRITVLGSLAIILNGFAKKRKTHIITLSFDDGFKKSFYKTAEIYEKFGLKACFNVIASAHLPGFQSPDNYLFPDIIGNFEDWNALQKRGHEIMPHTWDHVNLTQLPLEKAIELIDKCLAYFEKNLDGFDVSKAVYNFAFNASTPELEQYALSKVWAIRTQGETPINPIPKSKKTVRLGCRSFGPDNIDNLVEEEINKFLTSKGGWLILNTHGLDDEGWGPMSSEYLSTLLQRLVKIDNLEILPVGEVLKREAHWF
jgi:peptidoglycan/xylan/chitin deacetylase (PgdA/CDA1 family)